jgi:hypothetical protein
MVRAICPRASSFRCGVDVNGERAVSLIISRRSRAQNALILKITYLLNKVVCYTRAYLAIFIAGRRTQIHAILHAVGERVKDVAVRGILLAKRFELESIRSNVVVTRTRVVAFRPKYWVEYQRQCTTFSCARGLTMCCSPIERRY